MRKWEYKVLTRPVSYFVLGALFHEWLNAHGEAGWELVAVVGDTLYLKRPVEGE